MILDNGEQVFLWLGARSSEVEIKLAYKSAQVIYFKYMIYVIWIVKNENSFVKCYGQSKCYWLLLLQWGILIKKLKKYSLLK